MVPATLKTYKKHVCTMYIYTSTWFVNTNIINRIARFMPTVEVVQKHDTAARRLKIRGSNGKIYPYLVSLI